MKIFTIIWIVWCCSEILLNFLLRSGTTDKKNQDKGSIRFIWLMIAVAITAGVYISLRTPFQISNQEFIPYFGLAVIVIGMFFRFIAIWSLGRYFTVDVTIRQDHKIKNDGLYRILRHPSYTGSILSFVGFGLSLNNWVSLVIITVLVTSAMLYRIQIEEKTLINQFGQDYLDYMKKTYRLIPWIF